MPDLDTLRIIWWILLSILWSGFAITDGFDLGIATISPLVARNNSERRIVLNSIGPVWEGNQVWIVLSAGAIFAAWPFVYAVVFSGPYFIVLLLLLTLGIARPVSIKYRSKLENKTWRVVWDTVFFMSGIVPALIFGILVGNILQGIPFYFDEELRLIYSGSLVSLLNPFALWCGVTGIAMLVMHGGIYLAIKTENPVYRRALCVSQCGAIMMIILFAGGGFWLLHLVAGYQVTSQVPPNGFSNPLHKEVIHQVGAWLFHYSRYPLTMLAPVLGIVGALFSFIASQVKALKFAFLCSSLSILGVISTVGVSMFPFIVPSSLSPSSSLLVWDASSTQLTLFLMLIVVLIFVPLIILYTSWVYYVLRGKVTAAEMMRG